MPRIEFFLLLVLIVNALNLIALLPGWLLLRICRVGVSELSIFHGKPLATFPAGRLKISICRFPLGSSLTFDVDQFVYLGRTMRCLNRLAGSLTLTAIAFLLCGQETAIRCLVYGWDELISGAFHPHSEGRALIERLYAVFSESPVRASGIIAAAGVMLSLPSTAAFVLSELHDSRPHGWPVPVLSVATIACLLLTILWVVAGVLWVVLGGS